MKKVLIAIAAVFGVAVIGFGVLVGVQLVSDGNKEKVFNAAMEEFRAEINADEMNIDKINELAGIISSSDDYGKVEKAAKEYLRDVFVPFFKAGMLQEGAVIYKDGLTGSTITADQPDFKNTLAVIAEIDTYLPQIQNIADNLFSRDAAISYLEDGLDDYYINLFDKQVEEIYSDQQMRQNYIEYVETIRKLNTHYATVINFLNANAGKWYLEGDVVRFKTTALTNQYNQILQNIAND